MSDVAGSKLVAVTCPNHHNLLAEGLWNFFSCRHGVDLDFRLSGRSIPAHRLILEVFLSPDAFTGQHFLTQNWPSQLLQQEMITLDMETGEDGLSDSSDHAVLEFLYTGRVMVREHQLEEVLTVARTLHFQLLIDAIEAATVQQLEVPDEQPIATRRSTRTTRSSKRADKRAAPDDSNDDDDDGFDGFQNMGSGAFAVGAGAGSRRKTDTGSKPAARQSKTTGRKCKASAASKVQEKVEADRPLLECGDCNYQTRRRYDFRIHRAKHDGTTLFKCTKCSKTFFSETSLKSHTATHEQTQKGSKFHRCPKCPFMTPRRNRYESHLKTVHGGTGADDDDAAATFKCDQCVRWFETKELLELHRSRHAGGPAAPAAHQCPHCDYKVRSKFGLNVHMAKHDSSIRLFRCRTCSKSFLSEESFAAHNSRLHANDLELYECGQCDYKTGSKIRYQFHLTSKHDPATIVGGGGGASDAFPCAICAKVYLTEDSLQRHTAAVHSGGPKSHQCAHCEYKTHLISRFRIHVARHDPNVILYPCSVCGTKFHTAELLDRHRRRRHAHLPTNPPPRAVPVVHPCPHCEYSTRNRQLLRLHQTKHDPSITVLRCGLCNRAFFSTESLERHTRLHKVHSCPHCPYQTPKTPNYHVHLRTKHGVNAKGERTLKRFACSQCSVRYYFRAELDYHLRTRHSREKPFKCHLCSTYSSTRKADLKQHINVSHLKIRNFLCDTCGYAALSQYGLDEHSRIHTGLKPLKCSTCGRCFRARGSLRKHELLHGSDARPFVCDVCGHGFNRRSNLKVHLKNVHKLQMEPAMVM